MGEFIIYEIYLNKDAKKFLLIVLNPTARDNLLTFAVFINFTDLLWGGFREVTGLLWLDYRQGIFSPLQIKSSLFISHHSIKALDGNMGDLLVKPRARS